jgi:hypothetical protein
LIAELVKNAPRLLGPGVSVLDQVVSPLGSFLSQFNAVHDTTFHFLQIYFNILPISSVILTENSIGKTKNGTTSCCVLGSTAQTEDTVLALV